MRHQIKGKKLNRSASHRKALYSNLASSLIINKRIRTTQAKGKELKSFVERLITYAKRGGVHGRRLIQKSIQGKRGKLIANLLIHDIVPNCKNRNGGYIRMIKMNYRKNDNASIVLIEFVDILPEHNDVESSEVSESKDAMEENK